jgi:hypothetical protein
MHINMVCLARPEDVPCLLHCLLLSETPGLHDVNDVLEVLTVHMRGQLTKIEDVVF